MGSEMCIRDKYIENRPAKNINSWARNAIVPTLTMFGRFSAETRSCGVAMPWLEIAVVTHVIIPPHDRKVTSITPDFFLRPRLQPAVFPAALR